MKRTKIAPTLEALAAAKWNFMDTPASANLVGGEYARAEAAAWEAAGQELREMRRAQRETRKHLADLSQAVDYFLFRLDAEMKRPTDEGRGRAIAEWANGLDLRNQIAKRYALGRRLSAPERDAGKRAGARPGARRTRT